MENLEFYFEYAISPAKEDMEQLACYFAAAAIQKAMCREPTLALRRRVDMQDGRLLPWEWEVMHLASSQEAAARSFGDSMYFTAESLHPLHRQALEHTARLRALHDELGKLDESVTPCRYSRSSPLDDEYTAKAEALLKTKRLHSKWQRGLIPREQLDALLVPLRAERDAEVSRRLQCIDALRAEIAGLE